MTDFHDDDSGFWERNRSDLTIRVGRTKKRDVNRTRSHKAITRDMERPADVPYDADAEDAAPTTAMPRTRRRSGDTTSQRKAIRFDDHAYAALGTDVAADDAWHDFADGEEVAVEKAAPLTARWQRGGGVRSIDPRLLSVGAIAIVATLLVPLFGSLSGNGSDPEMRAIVAAPPSTEATTAPTTTLATTTAPPAAAVDEGENDQDDPRPDKDDRDTERAPSEAEWEAADDDTSSTTETSGAATADDGTESASTASSGDGDGIGSSAQGVLSAPASRVAAQCGNPYEVQAGDFWLSIAEEVGYGLDQFLAYNEADRDTPLYPGSVVCLPLGTSIEDETTTTEAPASTQAASTEAASTEASTSSSSSSSSSTSSSTESADATTEAPQQAQAAATTEPAPATTAEPAYEPPADIPDGGEVEQMIRAIWPDHLEEKALQIAWRESNYRPDVTSSIGCCLGVFQIHWPAHQSWLSNMGVTERSQLFDAETNIRAAYALYQRSGGWGPWAMTNY